MASAPAVQLAQPAGYGAQLHSSYLSTSSPFVGALLRPADRLRPGGLGYDGQGTVPAPRRASQEGAVAAARLGSDHARLHKRDSRAVRHQQPGNLCIKSSGAFERTSTPPIINEEYSDQPLTSSNKTSKIRLRRPFQSMGAAEAGTSLDLSKTTEENEERSGLAISSPSLTSPSINDTSFARNIKSRQHARTYSSTSANSAASGGFKPTEPFIHPMRQTVSNQSYAAPSDCQGDNRPISRNESEMFWPPKQNRLSAPSGVEPSLISRPILHVETRTSALQDTDDISPPKARSFRRRNTNQSLSSALSGTPSISDRALSFVRGGTHDTTPMDPTTRAASIRAARQAFNDQEAAKQAKYQRKEEKRRSKEKQESVVVESAPEVSQARAVTFIRDGKQRRKPKSIPGKVWRFLSAPLQRR